ncbi:MAG: hypothetical protein H5T91_02245 [Synergistetes bacterium]|nr:hypothetical protein [Synergistota bacterium]
MFEGRILDALDIEAVFVAEDEEEAKRLGIDLVRSFGLKDGDVVFLEKIGKFVRVRLRAYVYRPGDRYYWLCGDEAK